MALVLILKSVEDLHGKADRFAKATFRGLSYESKKVKGAKNAVYFGESFDWPIARNIEPEETLILELFNHNTYLTNKRQRLVGSITLVLQQIIQDGELSISENLVDANNRLIEARATFEVKYYSPDGKVGRWEEVEFQYPLIQQWNTTGDEVDTAMTGRGSSVDGLSERFNLMQDQDGMSQADTSSLLSFGSGMMTGEDTAAQQAALEAMYMAKQTRHDMLEAELHKPRDFQVNITILEAQQLSGLNIDPVIRVEVGNDKKYTAIKQSTNCPYYNEYFVFDYRQSPIMLFDKMITITAYDATRLPGRNVLKAGNILAGSVIGSFKCDVGTVYAASEHQFFHRWAVLLHPKDIMEGAKGYVKCDISVIGRGDVVKAQKPDKDEDNIEGNLLLPAGVPMERQSASYRVVIYRAEDLPRMDSGIMASVKKALTLTKQAFIDAYVKVSFVGHVGKTSVKKSYNPDFKEQLSFIDMFPPLCNRIKVELCDSDAISDEPIATHFIELPQIMDPGGEAEGILPTFGPSWINFYGAPRNYKMLEYYSDLNEGLGEGCAYRGRLLISVKTELLDADMASASTVYKDKVRSANKVEVAPRKEFLLFSTLLDASMIDKDYKDKEIYFEISIGTYGNTLDAKGETSLVSESEDSDEEDEGEKSKLIKKGQEDEENLLCHSTSEPMRGQSDDKCYYYLPIREEKPCLFVVSKFEDLRKRLYHSNIIDKMAEQLDEALEDLKVTLRCERPNQRYKLKCAMDELIKGCDVYMRMVSSLSVGAGSGKTKLDKHRIKSCEAQITGLKKKARLLKTGITRDNVRDRFKEAKDYLRKLRHLAKEPQHTLPDVFIWMVADKKRVAYQRVAAKDLLAATLPEQQGKDCGKVQTFFLKKPGKDGQGNGGWAIQAKLLMYLWLGQRDPKKGSRDFMKGIPEAYTKTAEVKRAHITPPRSLVFQGEVHFQLRAYLYQARSLIGSDDSGLSDPFARVIFWNQCQQSRIIEATLSPTWDQVLVFDKIIIHGDPKVFAASSLNVIVEFFDYDAVGEPEFLGRCMARPRVKMAAEPYAPPDFPAPLQWWDVFRGSTKAGELLGSFELLEGDVSTFPQLPAEVKPHEKRPGWTPIPQEIKPSVSKHRLEIMFWGVREPKRVQLLTVDRPRAEVEVAGVVTTTKPIANMQKNSNFDKTLDFVDLYLPDNEVYWPPLTIRVMDCRNFGREVLVGTSTVSALSRYIYVSREERLRRQEEQRQKEARLAALKDAEQDKPGSKKDAASLHGKKKGAKNGTQPQDTVIEVDAQSCVVPIGPDQVALTTDNLPLVDGATPSGGPPVITIIGPDGQPLPEGVLGVGPDGKPLPVGVSPLGPDGKPLPAGVLACGPDGKPLPPGVLGVGADGLPLPPGVPPMGADGKPLPTGSAVPGVPGAGGPGAPGGPGGPEAKKPIKNYKELIADLDWWSKFHVTMEDIEKEEAAAKENDTDDDMDDTDTLYGEEEVFKGEFRPMDYEGFDMDDIQRIKELPSDGDEDDPLNAKLRKKKKKKKKKNKKKQMKKRLKKLQGKFNQAFNKDDEEEEEEFEPEVEEDKSHIARIKVYDHELEEAPDYEGFEDWVQTFHLYRGKKVDDDEDDMARVAGRFKGTLCLYKLQEGDEGTQEDVTHTHSTLMPKLKLMERLPSFKPHEVLVRIYIVQAVDLHPVDLNGKADPYLVIKCGRRERNDKENKQSNTLNPVFGKMYELDVVFPMDSMLNIKVMDYDMLSSDDLIGETNIDLENRFFSKYRGNCGIATNYELFGYNTWRDPMKPTQIVAKLCKEHRIDLPVYGRNGDVSFLGQTFHADKSIENDQGEQLITDELMAMKIIQHWKNIPLGFPLVPEHIETRRLYNPEKPGVEQGRLNMWVDLFPKDQPTPTHTVDITARKPQEYELRCIIWNTDDVVLEDTNPLTGEASSDIFVRAYMMGMGEDDQSTDVHYRSLDGEGNFNWRMCFPFDYLKAEEKIAFKKKESIFSMDETEMKVPCKLTLQVWDADLVSADDYLGSVTLDLNRMPKPTKDSKNCTLKILGPEAPKFNLFKQKRCRGWLPMFADSIPEASEDSDDDDEDEKKGPKLIGKAEIEIHLMTKEEADKTPAGLGRDAPEALPEPNRPDTSFLWFMNPCKTLKFIIWKKYKWLILKLIIGLIITAFLALFLYTSPGSITQAVFSG